MQERALRAQQLQPCSAASFLSWVGYADTHDRILYSILWLLTCLKYSEQNAVSMYAGQDWEATKHKKGYFRARRTSTLTPIFS